VINSTSSSQSLPVYMCLKAILGKTFFFKSDKLKGQKCHSQNWLSITNSSFEIHYRRSHWRLF